jgi:hypothetical protein
VLGVVVVWLVRSGKARGMVDRVRPVVREIGEIYGRLAEVGHHLVEDDGFALGEVALLQRRVDGGGAHRAEHLYRLAGGGNAGLDVVGRAPGQPLLRRRQPADDRLVLVGRGAGRERDDQGDGGGELPLLERHAWEAGTNWFSSGALDGLSGGDVVLGQGDSNLANFLWDGTQGPDG